MNNLTGAYRAEDFTGYDFPSPFDPHMKYPEYGFNSLSDTKNPVYDAVRNLFHRMGLDNESFGKPSWNPLGCVISPGDNVVVKPNMVLHFNEFDLGLDSVVTHGSVLRAVCDYILIALDGRGKITVCDAPQMNCNFQKLIDLNGFMDVLDFYRKNTAVPVDMIDLRREMTIYRHGIVWERIPLPGDPAGYRIIDIGTDSEVEGIEPGGIYGADYNRRETIEAHSRGHHKYFISGTVLESDVFVCLPKMKVHKKAGVTLSLKNLVGISGNKNYLIHYRIGNPDNGGDEFSRKSWVSETDRKLKDFFLSKCWELGRYPFAFWRKIRNLLRKTVFRNEKVHEGGNWHGNDTVWRMALDLNKIVLYCDKDGNMCNEVQRKYLSVIDGFVAGEGNGPLGATPVNAGLVLAGFNPIPVDLLATRLMGLDSGKIPVLKNAIAVRGYDIFSGDIKKIMVKSVPDEWENILADESIMPFSFKPPSGWEGFMEMG